MLTADYSIHLAIQTLVEHLTSCSQDNLHFNLNKCKA